MKYVEDIALIIGNNEALLVNAGRAFLLYGLILDILCQQWMIHHYLPHIDHSHQNLYW